LLEFGLPPFQALSREEIYQRGLERPYQKFVNFPIEVSMQIEQIAIYVSYRELETIRELINFKRTAVEGILSQSSEELTKEASSIGVEVDTYILEFQKELEQLDSLEEAFK
jgi:hypothetical protein